MGLLRRLIGRLHAFFLFLLHEHRSPGRVVLALVLGCMVGATPLFGLHLPICLCLGYLLGLNQIVLYGAANISIPPLVPVLGLGSVEVGEYLRHGRWLALSRADFHGAALHALAGRFFVSWLIGGLLVGGLIGLGAGGIFLGLRAARGGAAAGPAEPDATAGPGEDRVRAANDQAIARARRRYDGLHPRFRYYARAKYRMDPCYRAICVLCPPGAFVVDLGTGLGLLPAALGELGEGRRVLGVEWDSAKVAGARQATGGLPGVEIVAGDIFAFEVPPCDVVTLVDVLHYYEEAGQRALLQRAAGALRPGGKLLIREGDRGRRGGARWTRWVERQMVRLGWNRGPRVNFRPIAALVEDLEALGLSVHRADVAGALHPGNVLLCATSLKT